MNIPFLKELERAQNVLLAGAGGGFDIFTGLPIYHWLRNAGKTVHLANLSFSDLANSDCSQLAPALFRVDNKTSATLRYFPELYLSHWLTTQFGNTPIYAIQQTGVRPIKAAYEYLVQNLQVDTIILIDGGTDSLMRGDEIGLGTPQEDIASLFAVNSMEKIARKFLVTVGFGIDTFHGVCHAHFLENTAHIIAEGGFLGTWSLMRESSEFRQYKEACDYVMARMPLAPSIVNTSLISAVEGRFGDFHATKKTEGSTLFINPLMGIYWAFQLESVARRNLYLNQIKDTDSYGELTMAIEKFQGRLEKTRPWKDISA